MGLDLKGKIWVFPREVGEKKVLIFETSINRKDGETYKDTFTLRVEFSKDILPDEKKKAFKPGFAYQMEIEGFLSTRGYDTDGGIKHRVDPVVKVLKAKSVGEPKEVKQKPKPEPKPEAPQEEPLEANPDGLPF